MNILPQVGEIWVDQVTGESLKVIVADVKDNEVRCFYSLPLEPVREMTISLDEFNDTFRKF